MSVDICRFYPGCPLLEICKSELGGPNLPDDNCIVAQEVLETGRAPRVTKILEEVKYQEN